MTRHSGHPEGGLSVLVVGNDTLIEMLPVRPIQLARACGRAGFDLVMPLSWGDELVAEAALTVLAERPPEPAVLCSCPLVRRRLLASGPELVPAMVSVVSPPVAVARHLRKTLGERLYSLAFTGRCPSAKPPEYDLVLDPRELREGLETARIFPEDEPDYYEDRIPPDRRRFASVPGGCPTAEHLWHRCNERVPVNLEGRDLLVDLAQALLAAQPLLVDLAPALGCCCSGVTPGTPGRLARIAVTSLEPPRASGPVIEAAEGIQLRIDAREPESRPAMLDREAERSLHSEVDSGADHASPAKRSRPPIAITPMNALRIPDQRK